MNTRINLRIALLPIILILVLSACSSGAASIKADEIIDRIKAEINTELQTNQQIEVQPEVVEGVETIPVDFQGSNEIAGLDLQAELINVYKATNPSVVYILNSSGTSGSGFVYDSEGHIVTNNHVVSGQSRFEVVFAKGDRMAADLVGSDVDSDLAVIKVAELPDAVEPIPLAESGTLQVGQFVIAIGNPFGEQGSMSFGIVSGLGRSLPSQRVLSSGSSYSLPDVIQTDAPINPGNSGGPLLNLDGEVVGVNAAIASLTGENTGVGFSIPVGAVHKIVPSLIEDGEYVYPYMGMGFDGEVSLAEQDIYGLDQTQGAYVVSVSPGGPAALAGIQAADQSTGRGGDLIIAINGNPIQDFADLNGFLVFEASVGQTIDLTIIRDGEQIVLPMTLGARP